MKLIRTEIIRGNNIYSQHSAMLMKITLEFNHGEFDLISVKDLISIIKNIYPQIFNNKIWVSEEKKIVKLPTNTAFGYLIVFIAYQLLEFIGIPSKFKKIVSVSDSAEINLLIDFIDEDTSKLGIQLSTKLIDKILRNEEYDIDKAINQIRRIWEKNQTGQLIGSIIAEARRQKIPIIQNPYSPKIQLGYGVNQKSLQSSFTNQTSYINVKLAGNKDLTKKILRSFGIPVPEGQLIFFKEDLQPAIKAIGYPIVIKPLSRNNGKGVSVNISNDEDALQAFLLAKSFSGQKGIIIENFIKGYDYRILIVNHKFVAAAMRTPAMIIGDGNSTVNELITTVNNDPNRGDGHTKSLSFIKIDSDTLKILTEKNISINTVLPYNEKLFLKSIGNISAGGTATDVTDHIHPHNILIAERISRIINLDICGLDIISPDISIPFYDNRSAVVEVNAAPGLRLHLQPTEGKPRNVTKPIIDMLFPKGSSPLIPIIVITGQLGISKLTGKVAELFLNNKFSVGYTNQNGVFIQNIAIANKGISLRRKAQLLLSDPTINMAVIECPPSDIIETGTEFQNCYIAIILSMPNVSKITGEGTFNEFNKAIRSITRSVLSTGYVVLNADDPNTHKISSDLKCSTAYFSLVPNNPLVINHVKKGGYAAIIENNKVIGYNNLKKINICNLNAYFKKLAANNFSSMYDVLSIVLVGFIYNLDLKQIKDASSNIIRGIK